MNKTFLKVVKWGLLGLVAIVLVFVVIVALQPSHFQIERSITIAAPQATVFQQVNDFHNWDAWSPWAKLDPAAKKTFPGAAAGKDAGFTWDGNDKIGAGQMTILESRPSDLIRIKLEFMRPHAGTSDTVFTFKPEGDQTRVTWTMSGENDFMGRAFCLIMNMDKMVGGDFEKGLAAMKTIAEGKAKK